jgi:hypothetical protein
VDQSGHSQGLGDVQWAAFKQDVSVVASTRDSHNVCHAYSHTSSSLQNISHETTWHNIQEDGYHSKTPFKVLATVVIYANPASHFN